MVCPAERDDALDRDEREREETGARAANVVRVRQVQQVRHLALDEKPGARAAEVLVTGRGGRELTRITSVRRSNVILSSHDTAILRRRWRHADDHLPDHGADLCAGADRLRPLQRGVPMERLSSRPWA